MRKKAAGIPAARKIAEGGKFGEVFVDATVGLPLIVAAVLERLKKNPKAGPEVVGRISERGTHEGSR